MKLSLSTILTVGLLTSVSAVANLADCFHLCRSTSATSFGSCLSECRSSNGSRSSTKGRGTTSQSLVTEYYYDDRFGDIVDDDDDYYIDDIHSNKAGVFKTPSVSFASGIYENTNVNAEASTMEGDDLIFYDDLFYYFDDNNVNVETSYEHVELPSENDCYDICRHLFSSPSDAQKCIVAHCRSEQDAFGANANSQALLISRRLDYDDLFDNDDQDILFDDILPEDDCHAFCQQFGSLSIVQLCIDAHCNRSEEVFPVSPENGKKRGLRGAF